MKHKNFSFTMKSALLSLTVALMLGITACAEDIIDSANITIKQTPASLDAPNVKGKVYKGVNIITWEPVKNATGYRLYRDNVYLKNFAYATDALRYEDYARFDENSIKDKQKYTYTVVATGVQASRGTNASTSNTTDFVMTDADILGDSMASVTLTAKVPAAFTKVEAAKKPELKYVDDVHHGRVCGLYFTKPEYLGATVKLAHSATGANVDIFSHFDAAFYSFPYGGGNYADYAWVPFYYGGSYSYKITTYWPNPFYQSNDDLSGDIEIPSAEGKYAPIIYLHSEIDGVVVTVDDFEADGSYTLYRADANTDKAYSFSAIATGDKFKYIKDDCTTDFGYYTYKDTTAELGKQYIYMITGTIGGKALLYTESLVGSSIDLHTHVVLDTLTWDPQFAAINNGDGTVSLSWNVEKDINYKVLKCTIASEDGINADAHTEEYLTVDASKVAAAINDVFVMTDTITKLTGHGWYKYTLIGTDSTGILTDQTNDVQDTADAKITYNETSPLFGITGVYAYDTKKTEGYNGINDTINVSIAADNSINMSTIKFYRAEIARDNKQTSAGREYLGDDIYGDPIYAYYEFVTDYKPVTLTLGDSTAYAGQTVYQYNDTSLTEADLAMKAYIYIAAVTVDGKDLFADILVDNKYTMCYSDITMPDIICEAGKIEGANGPEAKDIYKLSWNARFAETIPLYDPTDTQVANSAVLNIETAWSNASSVYAVTEAWTAVTDYSLADSTYFKEFSINKDNNYNYLYVRVTLANAADDDVFTKKITNRAYVGQVDSTVYDIGVADIYTTKTDHSNVCYIMMEKGSADLLASNYTIYVTYLNGSSVIYSVPVPAGSLTKVTVTRDNTDSPVNALYTSDDYPTWYFSTPTTEDTNVTAVLVHVETTEGEIARTVVGKWW